MDRKLYEAAMNGDLNYLQTPQVTSSNLQFQRTPCQETVLHVATEFHKTEFAKAVVRACPALLWLANSSGDTALHMAARENYADMVEFFIKYARSCDVESGGYKHLTRMANSKKDMALHSAAERGSEECVELLVQEDPEVCSFVNNANESPIYLCVASGSSTNMLEILLKRASSSASHKGPNGLTALHASILEYYYEFEEATLLVEWRSEMIREGDDLGMTPLHYAAFYGKIEALKLLLKYDSSAIYLLNNDDQSAVHFAAFNGEVEALEELIKHCPDCYNMVDKKGRTALHAAVLGHEHEVVKFILKEPRLAGLINKADKDGNTPLHLAAYFKLYKTMKLFKRSKKVCFKILNNQFLTPFDVGNEHICKLRGDEIKDHLVAFRATEYTWGIVAAHDITYRQQEMMRKEAKYATEETSTDKQLNKEKENIDFGLRSALEVNLLVAMLVATVTFAAGFTVPGGLLNKGEDEGLATLTNKPAFKAFVVFNTLAFCSSILSVFLHLRSSIVSVNARLFFKKAAERFTIISILTMVLAFCSGTYVVLTKSTQLSLVPYVVAACSVPLYLYKVKFLYWRMWIKIQIQSRKLRRWFKRTQVNKDGRNKDTTK